VFENMGDVRTAGRMGIIIFASPSDARKDWLM
jgi:hypothetical protein